MKPKHTILLFLITTLFSTSVLSSEIITIESWLSNTEISKIRKLYKQIQTSSYNTKKNRYNTKSSDCSTYPIKEKSITVEKSGQVRKLSITQLISHREPLLIERFYDSNGIIRFVFTKSATSETRIYLNNKGNVIWAVNKDNNKFYKADYANDDWEMKPSTSKDAKLFFNTNESCSEK